MTIDIAPVEVEAPVREKTESDILLAAARYIEEHGWTQQQFQSPHGAVCAYGAMMMVCHGTIYMGNGAHLCDHAYMKLNQLLGDDGVPVWNDGLNRTQGQVISKLREAAAS